MFQELVITPAPVYLAEKVSLKSNDSTVGRGPVISLIRGVKQVRTFVSLLFATSILADICSEQSLNRLAPSTFPYGVSSWINLCE